MAPRKRIRPATDGVALPDESSIVVERVGETDDDDTKAKRARVEKLLALARRQLKSVDESEQHYRENAVKDAEFRAGTWGTTSYQWPEGVQEQRLADNRPCLTINRMPSFIRQVTNQQRAAHLGAIVSPNDDAGDPKAAEVLQGIIHNIEKNSVAETVYATGGDKQAEIGRGYWRIVTEWADEESFRQRLRLEREPNPLQIYMDPSIVRWDASDADFALKLTDISIDKWKEMTGRNDPPTAAAMEGLGIDAADCAAWFPSGKIRIAEWFNREAKGEAVRKAQLSDGSTIRYPSEAQQAELTALGITILRERRVQPKVMMWRKMDGVNLLEETEWVCDEQPWIPDYGEEILLHGEKDWRGVTRDSMAAARVYNVEVSALVENVGLGTKAPVVGYTGQFGKPGSPQRKAWETAHSKPHAFLEMDPVEIDGKPAPLGQRVPFEAPIEGIVVAIHQADEDYKSTAGFNDASLGVRGPQESGKAILARQKQDELGSSHYLDNHRLAIAATGRRLIKCIRKVYDAPQVVRIMGKDQKPRKVMVFSGKDKDPRNEQFLATHPGPQALQMKSGAVVQPGQKIPFELPDGVKEIYDLGTGEFDVEVSASPWAGSRRQEAVEAITQLFQALPPEIMTKFLDLYFGMMDFPMAHQMTERAKALMPPELQGEEDGGEPLPPQAAAKIHQMQTMMQKMGEALKQAEGELQGKQQELLAKVTIAREANASREKIAAQADQADLAKTEATLNSDQALAQVRAQLEHLSQLLDMLHEQRMAHDDQHHERAMAADDAVAQVAIAAATRQPEAPTNGGAV